MTRVQFRTIPGPLHRGNRTTGTSGNRHLEPIPPEEYLPVRAGRRDAMRLWSPRGREKHANVLAEFG